MSEDISKITIANEHWNEDDVNEISDIFSGKFSVEKRDVGRWEAEELAPILWIIFVFVGKNIVSGFLNAIGTDLWNSLKNKFSKKISEKNYSELRISIENNDQKISLDLNTDNPELFEKAFDLIDNALKQVDSDQPREDFHFDNKKQEWIKEANTEIERTMSGVSVAAEVPFEKNGRTIKLRKEDLPKIAQSQIGLPLGLGHGGRKIGIITKAWVDDNKVRFEAGIFKGLSAEEEEQLKKMKGVSMEFSHSGFEEYKDDKES